MDELADCSSALDMILRAIQARPRRRSRFAAHATLLEREEASGGRIGF